LESTAVQGSDFQESDSYWLIDETNLTPGTNSRFNGSEGHVLDAIQYLANATLNLNQTQEQQASYTVELNYRVRRQAEIA